MTETEFQVLDELYFVVSYQDLLQSVSVPEAVLADVLLDLLHQEWIVQMIYDNSTREYLRIETTEPMRLQESFFTATKAGLMAHNSR